MATTSGDRLSDRKTITSLLRNAFGDAPRFLGLSPPQDEELDIESRLFLSARDRNECGFGDSVLCAESIAKQIQRSLVQ